MVSRLLQFFAFAALAVGCTAVAPTGCAVRASVDHHIARPALDASVTPTFGWQLSSGCAGVQQAYRIVVTTSATALVVWDSGRTQSNSSANIACGVALEHARAYTVQIEAEFSGSAKVSSAPTPFLTMVSASVLTAAPPMWHSTADAQFVLLRRTVVASPQQQTYLSVTAKPSPEWGLPHGRNTSHLLCAYKLWVNGVSLGVGPGRKVGGGISVDTYNITALLQQAAGSRGGGSGTIAIEAYYGRQPGGGGNTDDTGGVLALLHAGNGERAVQRGVMEKGNGSDWEAFDATAAFGPSNKPRGHGAGTGYYTQPVENIHGALYPHGWRVGSISPAGAASGWSAAASRAAFADGVFAREALPVALLDVEAASFTALAGAGGGHHYLIDFGRELQGGLNVTFSGAAAVAGAGTTVTVRLGEQLLSNGTGVLFHALSGNTWESNWTISGTGGAESFVPHEYVEFRYAEIIGAPEPPIKALVRGWAVRYPFDGDLNEHGSAASVSAEPSLPTATVLSTSSAALNQLWELVQWTVVAGTIDLNADSNTRQRDVCTLDAYLQTLYQAGTFPTTAFHHRRRVTQFMFEYLGYVNTWTEFLVSPIGALSHFVEDYDDAALLSNVWRNKSALETFSLSTYFDSERALVVDTPKPLVDWPRSDALDVNRSTSGVCSSLCVEMNGHAATAQGRMAALATRLGLGAEAQAYAARAAAIRAAANATFAATAAQCSPAGVGVCYTDKPNEPPTPPAPPAPTPVPAPVPVADCGVVLEKDRFQQNTTGQLALNCGAGQVVSAVLFADFGTPSGACPPAGGGGGGGGFHANASCTDAAHSMHVVKDACMGKQQCTLIADRAHFADMCEGVPKRLAVQVTCAPASVPAPAAARIVERGTITTAHASVSALDARLPGRADSSLALVPFLRARNARRGHAHGLEVSGWVAGFMLRGLYSAAGEVNEGDIALPLAADAAQLGWETLTHNGTNSWLGGMIGQMNATMTTESWIIGGQDGEGGGTMSHPWTAAPAYIVPRYLMGVRPLEGGWRRVAVRPLPPSATELGSATLVTPTPRGAVALSFAQGYVNATTWTFAANVTLPGNTRGEICVPRYTAPGGFACSSEPATVRRGAMLCLTDDIIAGTTHVLLVCQAA